MQISNLKQPHTTSTESATNLRPPRKEQRTENYDSGLGLNAPIAAASWMTTGTSGNVNNVNGSQFNDCVVVYEANEQLAIMTQNRLKAIHDTQLADKIHQWLSPPDSSNNYNAARKKHHTKTCSWFINGAHFAEWKAKPGLILWVYGPPGCGKTILCSSAIENIIGFCEANLLVGYAYFFFDSRNSQNELLLHEKLIRSLISQLSDQCGGMPSVLANAYGDGHRQPSIDTLQGILQCIIEGFDHAYLMIDSLDECTERFELLEWIQQTARRKSGKLHLLVTSRKERDIEESLNSIVDLGRVVISGESVHGDIGAYLDAKLSKANQWKLETRLEIKDALMKGADGMFRWVALQLDELRNCPSRQTVREKLKTLPKHLEGIYEEILSRSAHRDQLKVFLEWLAFSTREMTVAEIAEVSCVDLQSADGPSYDIDRQYDDPQYVLIVCSGLITEFEGSIKLAHFSVKEYLISERIRNGAASDFSTSERISHAVIAQTCLAYLLHFDKLDSITSENIQSFPLAKYAARFWIVHIRSAGDVSFSVLQRLIADLFLPESGPFINWIRLYDIDEPRKPEDLARSSTSIATPLYYASLTGLQYVLKQLLANCAEVNAQGGYCGNALQAASVKGHEAIVHLLLVNCAEVNAEGGEFGTALQAASLGGHEAIVQLLLENGADVNVNRGPYGNALGVASAGGHEAIVQLLLANCADANARGVLVHGNALPAASAGGHEAIVQLLLENGADVNAKGGFYGNALQGASAEGHEATVKLLLENGADVNAQGKPFPNALQAASAEGHEAIVQLLLENGVEVNAQGGPYGNALQAASVRGHEAIVQLLLENGAEVNAQGGDYGNALQAASVGGHEAIIKLLLENGAVAHTWEELYRLLFRHSRFSPYSLDKVFSLDMKEALSA